MRDVRIGPRTELRDRVLVIDADELRALIVYGGQAVDMEDVNIATKPTAISVPRTQALTTECVAAVYRRLTGREGTPEEIARLRARLDRPVA